MLFYKAFRLDPAELLRVPSFTEEGTLQHIGACLHGEAHLAVVAENDERCILKDARVLHGLDDLAQPVVEHVQHTGQVTLG